MRKQTKLVAVLSATALLAIGASMASFAATKGWVEENGVWSYLDSNGDAVTADWKKSGSQYFWLDENGEMATEALIEDDEDHYYVDASGARVVNSWKQVDNEDGWTNQEADEEPAQIWYYFGSNGKAQTGKKTINGKTYFFDEDGEMFYSWYDYETTNSSGDPVSKTYYLGEETEGWAYTGWQYLALREDDEEDYDDEEQWFHFKSAGDMRKAGDGKVTRAYISGAYYGFDDKGVMVDGWKSADPTATPNTATNPTAFYTEDSGNQPKGWVFTYTEGDWNDKNDDQEWYYLNSKGEAYNNGGKDSTDSQNAYKIKEGNVIDKMPHDNDNRYTAVRAKYIKKETYLFGSDGVMLTGVMALGYEAEINNSKLEGLSLPDSSTSVVIPREGGAGDLKPGIYYFNKNSGSSLGQMETGKVTVSYDGENYYYNFRKKVTEGMSVGSAYTSAIVDGCLYDGVGKRINADESKEYYEIDPEFFGDTITNGNGTILIDISRLANENKLNENGNVGIIITSSGKVTKSGKVTIDGTVYDVGTKYNNGDVADYVAAIRKETE